VRELANVDLGFLGNRLRSAAARDGPKLEKERICLRFFAALVLLDLISEVRGSPSATLQRLRFACVDHSHRSATPALPPDCLYDARDHFRCCG
jgi:hypothetical protein